MTIKSNTVTITVKEKTKKSTNGASKDIPISLDGIQLCILNAERLHVDSHNVSIPTKMALLELGLEEISKAWGLLLAFEKQTFDQNPNLIKTYFELLHIDLTRYTKAIQKNEPKIKKYLSDMTFKLFLHPFDKDSFTNHRKKIKFLSKLIWYIKNITLPLLKSSQDREKFAKDILGKYVGKIDLKTADKVTSEILSINEGELEELVSLKEKGIYVDIEGGTFINPSSRNYYPDILQNLLVLLISMSKNELTTLSKALWTS